MLIAIKENIFVLVVECLAGKIKEKGDRSNPARTLILVEEICWPSAKRFII